MKRRSITRKPYIICSFDIFPKSELIQKARELPFSVKVLTDNEILFHLLTYLLTEYKIVYSVIPF